MRSFPCSLPVLIGLGLLGGCYPAVDLSGVGKAGSIDTGGPDGDADTDADTDTDTDTDTPEPCTVYSDADGDGFGDPESGIELPCDEVPDGAVDNGDDCDDGRADVFPGAPEQCDEVDNDCDAQVDEDLEFDWYADTDGDGFGDAGARVETCDPPEGLVSDATDCDDTRADTFPGADELCDGADNDCDGELDEDAIDRASWYADTDSDGYGDPDDMELACDPVPGRVADATDCDDTDGTISPEGTEVCDSVDNDCDGDIDDADGSLDASTTTTWYADTDTDGFGDVGATTQSCAQPSGYVADATDCDDGAAAVNPDASEICNAIDDDCDELVDDADDSVDTTTGSTWHADGDGDGYGDAASTVAACDEPAGYVADATDCEDGIAAINPGATEICDEIDNDCDGDIDDADADLDLSTAATWYEDDDGDGLGSSASTELACEQPSGYVDNDVDCDDGDATDASDLDGDGTPDCSDDDIDGDGLRDEWDGDPEDPSIARGPTEGLGTDGALNVSGTETQTDWTVLSSGVALAGTTLPVDDSSHFSVGDEVLVLSQLGVDAGQYQFVYVSGVSTGSLTIEPPLTDAYDSGSVVLVQRVPHYTTASISGTLAASPWAGAGGGVVVFRSTGAVTVAGQIETQGMGYEGGAGVSGNGSQAYQGDSFLDFGLAGTATANDGGGGAYPTSGDGCEGGGGAGHAAAGSNGYGLYCTAYIVVCLSWSNIDRTAGGDAYGAADLSTLYLGSGGGAGAPDSESDGNDSRNVSGDGGDGGGIVLVYSGTSISVSGQIDADGEEGEDGDTYGGEVGAGGGGAGGSILLAAPSLTFNGDVEARGRGGGRGESYSYSSRFSANCGGGGDGSDGRIRLEYTTASGLGFLDPAPGSTGPWTP